ncbi:MAG: hypothetical protein H7Y36_03975 [Armatimonadetes bacterium]|nr:hypothetical protein [Akkermansiaceae bacterium]
MKLIARVGFFLLIGAIAVWFFLVRQSGTQRYTAGLEEGLKEKLAAEEIVLRGFSRQKGEFYISRFAMTGGEKTFFSSMEIRNLKCRIGLLNAFTKEWDPGLIQISRADVDLRAGADSKEAAESMAKVLFQETGRLKLDAFDVKDMTLRWGYSERTRGTIVGSKMRVQRVADKWKLVFRGGTFSQNWLKRLAIEELIVVFGKDGIVFEKAVFKKGQGYVSLTDLKVIAGERPDVTGKMNLRKMDVSGMVPVAARNFIEGTVSGEFKVFGSTNSSEGIGYEGDVVLNGEDVLVLRDRVHLLRALSVVDAFNNYRRLNFKEGVFHLKTHGGKLEVTNLDMKAGDLFSMKGNMKVRLPTEEEAKNLTTEGQAEPDSDAILSDEELEGRINLSLANAAKDTSGKGGIGFEKSADDSLFARLGVSIENRALEEQGAERLSRTLRYEGEYTISLPKEAFARSPQLAEMYPLDTDSGRIAMKVPIEGVLYDLTIKQAEEIYKKGTR